MLSKPLVKNDLSGDMLSRDMLDGDMTAGINFDRIQKHPNDGYIIFEYQKCDENQLVTPYTSDPNRYWNKCHRKYFAIWEIVKLIKGKLYIVNYADKNTKHGNLIKLMEVKGMDYRGIIFSSVQQLDRNSFSLWFRKLNKECL